MTIKITPRSVIDINCTVFQRSLFFCLQAFNRAGLAGKIISKRFIRDMSPPAGGHVLDGPWDDKV